MAAVLSIGLAGCASPPATQPPLPPSSASGAISGTLDYSQVLTLALKGNHDAEFELGAMFHDGDGVSQDDGKALEWYRKSAESGNRQAAFNLGLMIKNGERTPSDPAEALSWFVRATDAGDVRAMLLLGTTAYAKKEFTIALPYFLKAAKAGLVEAQLNAGVMYVRGEGVDGQDVTEAYAWLTLAKDGGNARAAGMLDSLSTQMTAEQITKGDARAAELRKEIKE